MQLFKILIVKVLKKEATLFLTSHVSRLTSNKFLICKNVLKCYFFYPSESCNLRMCCSFKCSYHSTFEVNNVWFC